MDQLQLTEYVARTLTAHPSAGRSPVGRPFACDALVLERFWSGKRSERLRAVGWLVLVSGVIAAVATYGVAVQYADGALNDATALGYRRSLRHGVGATMGGFGLMLTEWQEAWMSPLGMAITVAVCAGLFAAYFFRVAWVLDDDEREERLHSRPGQRGDGPE